MASASYAELLRQAQPEVIRDDRSHQRALKAIDALMCKQRLTAAEGKLVDLLAKLVEDYEERIHPTPDVSPAAMLDHFLGVRGVAQADLARSVGIPRSTISEVLKGKRSLSIENAFRLGEFFSVEPSLFLSRR